MAARFSSVNISNIAALKALGGKFFFINLFAAHNNRHQPDPGILPRLSHAKHLVLGLSEPVIEPQRQFLKVDDIDPLQNLIRFKELFGDFNLGLELG